MTDRKDGRLWYCFPLKNAAAGGQQGKRREKTGESGTGQRACGRSGTSRAEQTARTRSAQTERIRTAPAPRPKSWAVAAAAAGVVLLAVFLIFLAVRRDSGSSGNVLKEYTVEAEGSETKTWLLGSDIRCEDVLSVTFLDSLGEAPADAQDVSAKGDGSVLAWTVENGDGYDVYIGAEGGVAGNANSKDLFRDCVRLERISFNDSFDTSQVTNMSAMFYNCSSMREVDISCFETSRTVNMGGMFYNCASLTSLDVSGFDTSQVWDMSYLFHQCSSLVGLDVSGFDTSQVTSLRTMFQNCAKLTELDVSGFDTSRVTDMAYMFYGCSGLTSLDITGFDMSGVENSENMLTGTRWEYEK